jgi:hypothetical protein
MSALALVAGKLHGEPLTRPTRNGGQVTFFKLRVVNGTALDWWDVATFSDTAREELDGLSEGDALSAVGRVLVRCHAGCDQREVIAALRAPRIGEAAR